MGNEVPDVQWIDLGDLTRVGNIDLNALHLVEDRLGDGWVLDEVLPDERRASARWRGEGPPVIAGDVPDVPADVPPSSVKSEVRPRHVPPHRPDGPGGKALARDEAVRQVRRLTSREMSVTEFLFLARDAWDKHITTGRRGEYCWVRHVTLMTLAQAAAQAAAETEGEDEDTCGAARRDGDAASVFLMLYECSCRPRADHARRGTRDVPLSRVVARCADRELRMTRVADAYGYVSAGMPPEDVPDPDLSAPFAWDGITDARDVGVVQLGPAEIDPVLDAEHLRDLRWLSGASLARLHARGMRGAVADPQRALTSLVSPARRERTVRVAACLHRGAVWTPGMLAAAARLNPAGLSPQYFYSLRNAGLARLAVAHDGTLLVAGTPSDPPAWRALRKRLGVTAADWEKVTGGGVPLAPASAAVVPHDLAVTRVGLAAAPYGRWVPEPAAYLKALAGKDVPGLGKCRADGALILYPGDPSQEITVCFEVTSPSALRGDTARIAKKAGLYLWAMQAPDARPLIVVYVLLSQPHLAGNDNERAQEVLAKGIGAGAGPRNRVLIAQWADVLQGLPDITGLGVDSVRQRDEDSLRLVGFHRTDGGEFKRGWVPRRLDGQSLTDAPDQVRDIPA